VVGVFAHGETTFLSVGERAPGQPAADEDTLFRVCSITKALTGTLLGDAVVRGRMKLDDEAQAHLTTMTLPRHPAGPIRVEHLATYTAGFPWQPTNFPTSGGGRDYTAEKWRAFVEGFTLPAPPGESFRYGNVGFALLGDVLADDARTSLADLFHARLFAPLGMKRSGFAGERPLDPNRAQGFDEDGKLAGPATDTAQAGACAVETTAADLLAFLRAHFDERGPLYSAMRLAVQPRRAAGESYAGNDVGLGWFVKHDGSPWKAGAFAGFRSEIQIDLARDVAVAVLAADERVDQSMLADGLLADVRRAAERAPAPLVASIPAGAEAHDVLFDDGLRLVAIAAPVTVKLGHHATVHYYYRVERTPAHEWRVFVHADAPHERVRGDHALGVPMRSLQPGMLLDDAVDLDFRADLKSRDFTLYSGFFRLDSRMSFTPPTEDKRVAGPKVTLATP
jgi:CubicO group peptidase (beta-lactamase class C family)